MVKTTVPNSLKLPEAVASHIARCHVIKFYRDLYFGYSPGIVAASVVSRDWSDIYFQFYFGKTTGRLIKLSKLDITT